MQHILTIADRKIRTAGDTRGRGAWPPHVFAERKEKKETKGENKEF